MNNTSVLSVAKNRVVWLDVVRFVAMFTVVCCHCADPFNFYSGEPSAELELFFTYNSLNVVMMTIPFFLLAKKVNVRSELVQKLLANLTICGFGVYMVHFFFTGPGVLLMRAIGVPVCIQIPAAAVVAFTVSWLLVNLIRKLTGKSSKYIVG